MPRPCGARRRDCDGIGKPAQSGLGDCCPYSPKCNNRAYDGAMDKRERSSGDAASTFAELLRIQGEAARRMMEAWLPTEEGGEAEWSQAARKVQDMWLAFHEQQVIPEMRVPLFAGPAEWIGLMQCWFERMPPLDPARQQRLFEEGAALWETVLAQYGDDESSPELPRADRRFADPAWRAQPVFALIHQTYLLMAERILEAVDAVEGLGEREREQ